MRFVFRLLFLFSAFNWISLRHIYEYLLLQLPTATEGRRTRFSFVCSQRVTCCTRTMEWLKSIDLYSTTVIYWISSNVCHRHRHRAIALPMPATLNARAHHLERVKQDISDNTYLIRPISLAPIPPLVNWYHPLICLRVSSAAHSQLSNCAKPIKALQIDE